MEPTKPPTATNIISNKLLHMLKIAYYMLRKGILSKRKLVLDLHLLLKRSKIITANLLHGHHHHHHRTGPTLSCRFMDPATSFYNPVAREVEFSCSNTPSYAFPPRRGGGRKTFYSNESEVLARAFAMMNFDDEEEEDEEEDVTESVGPSPLIGFGRSPRVVRQLRVTDSPFPIKEDEVVDGRVDKEAEEFIRRFYEQLKVQQSTAVATPECYKIRRGGRRG